MKQAGRLAGIMITFIGAVLFSTKAILVKLAFRDVKIDVVSLLALRMFFSMPFFLLAAWWSAGDKNVQLTRQDWFKVVVLGLMGYYVSSWFDFEGLQYISAGLERLILFLYPSFTALINFIFYKQVLGKRQLWALILTYIGIAIAYYGEFNLDAANQNFLLGSIFVFICSVTYAIYMAGAGRMVPKVGVTRFTAYAMLSATLGIFIHFSCTHPVTDLHLTGSMWKYGLLLAVFATVLPSFLISAGMKRIGSNNAAIVSSIGPVSTIIQANIFLGEKMHAGQIIGTILVIAGVLLIGWKTSPAG
ncbi:DMT family transporter [Flavihumibacter fluvii]|uniref:DMT family transporter n=1 Tax=Flavihumibacter fluvii TaxID=2838157 RepID=UPI001BDE968F|nr:DMT family transporter [Flavihumibacter fluvii]ULQ53519.1 DMT family transporter [Flavihumibacter fluvii]